MAVVGAKKSHHIGLWVTLILIFVIIILPVGLVFAFFFDPTHVTSEEIGVDTTSKKQSLAENLVVDLFDYTDDANRKNSLSIKIGETEINQLLYDNLLSVMDANTKSLVPQAYIEIQNDKYVFVIEGNAYGFFKSRLFLTTTLTMSDNPKGLMFEVTDIKIARLGGLQGLAFSILSNFINDSKLNQIFKDSLPLSIESHLFDGQAKRYLFYPHESFVKDVNGMINIGGDMAFFKDFLIDMVSSGKFSFDFYSDKQVAGLLSLQEFHDNSLYGSYSDYVIDFGMKSEINKYLPTLLKNGEVNNNNIDTYAKFLSFGYTQLSEIEKLIINNSKILPSLLNKSLESYSNERTAKFALKGKTLKEVEPLEDIVSTQVKESLLTKYPEIIANKGGKIVDAKVDEMQFHDVTKNNPAIGYGKVFYRVDKDGSYKVSFLSIDNFYLNIVNNNLYFVIGVNINGYEVSMILSTIIEPGEYGQIRFQLDSENAYFGNYNIPANLFSSFSSFIGDAVGSSSWLSYEKSSNSFIIDFSEPIDSIPQIAALKALGYKIDVRISARGSKIGDNGYLNIAVDAKKS